MDLVHQVIRSHRDDGKGSLERTTGTINPGAIYVADKFQLAVEAIIPVNRASGDNVGVMGQLHLYLDDIFPHSIGKPLFGPTSAAEGVGY